MKRLLVGFLIVAVLVCSTPRLEAPPPKPQFVTCVMTILCLGIFCACAVVCYYHAWNSDYSGPTNSPPIVPMPTNTDTNLPPHLFTNATPFVLGAYQGTEHIDVTASNWVDSVGAQVTDLYRTTIQTASSPAGPWSNAYVVTHWASAYASTAVVEDGAGTPLKTNFALRSDNGSVTNFLPLEMTFDQPQKFWRGKP